MWKLVQNNTSNKHKIEIVSTKKGLVWQFSFWLSVCVLGLPRWWSRKRICLLMQEMQETWVWSLGWEDPLEEEMATHSSILAWKISWTEELGELHFMGSQSRTWQSTQRNMMCVLQSMVSYIWGYVDPVWCPAGILHLVDAHVVLLTKYFMFHLWLLLASLWLEVRTCSFLTFGVPNRLHHPSFSRWNPHWVLKAF